MHALECRGACSSANDAEAKEEAQEHEEELGRRFVCRKARSLDVALDYTQSEPTPFQTTYCNRIQSGCRLPFKVSARTSSSLGSRSTPASYGAYQPRQRDVVARGYDAVKCWYTPNCMRADRLRARLPLYLPRNRSQGARRRVSCMGLDLFFSHCS